MEITLYPRTRKVAKQIARRARSLGWEMDPVRAVGLAEVMTRLPEPERGRVYREMTRGGIGRPGSPRRAAA